MTEIDDDIREIAQELSHSFAVTCVGNMADRPHSISCKKMAQAIAAALQAERTKERQRCADVARSFAGKKFEDENELSEGEAIIAGAIERTGDMTATIIAKAILTAEKETGE